jgi:hypothetical protein
MGARLESKVFRFDTNSKTARQVPFSSVFHGFFITGAGVRLAAAPAGQADGPDEPGQAGQGRRARLASAATPGRRLPRPCPAPERAREEMLANSWYVGILPMLHMHLS